MVDHLTQWIYLCRSKEYNQVWNDIRTYSQIWKSVLVPAPCVQDQGASEMVYSSFPSKIVFEHMSPIIMMRAQKNSVEQEGMRMAHIRDGAAICEAMSNLETRVSVHFHRKEAKNLNLNL